MALRYIRGSKRENKIASALILICCIGIFIGTAALALTTIIMNGVEQGTLEKLRSINAPIIIQDAQANGLDFTAIAPILRTEFPQIKAFSPVSTQRVIIQNPHEQEVNSIVVLKVIDPAYAKNMSSLNNKITTFANEKKSVDELVHADNIVLGAGLARTLGITHPQPIILLAGRPQSSRKIALSSHEVFVSGILTTGIDDIDNNMALASETVAQKIEQAHEVTHVEIELWPKSDEQATIAALQERFNLDVLSWKDLYPAIVSALRLEKYALFLILALITIVASMNIISLLFMYITQKRSDIALLLALGMQRTEVQTIFMIIGICISVVSCITGLIFAIAVGLFLQHYPLIKLPDTYYVTHLPAQVDFAICFLVAIVVIAIGCFASWLPTRCMHKFAIAHTLRSER